MTIEEFKRQFTYNQHKIGFLGVEQEVVIEKDGKIVPMAHEILSTITSRGIFEPAHISGNYFSGDNWEAHKARWHPVEPNEFGYELPAAQIESRIGPCQLKDLKWKLEKVNEHLILLLKLKGCRPLHIEVAPEDMPLDVYPTERYQKITKNMPRAILLAACRVAGTHVHIGMRDHAMALRVYNYVIKHLAELCEMGNGSFGERLAIYKQMAPDYEPKLYASWDEYYQTALAKGFAEDPRKCWTLIRISVHGTIEFRMFGATDSIDRIVNWATRCHQLCQEAMIQA